MPRLAPAFALLLAAAVPAFASSDDAWQEFAGEVGKKCLEAAAPMLEGARVAVDPFGSERFGLAVLSGKAKGADVTVSYVCVMDKQTGVVELGSELSAETLGVTIP
ncbi:MAG: hypothetical protein K0M55_04205 [Rhizobium sp.]|nr:hypothetical protein [Rhizobium sp.]